MNQLKSPRNKGKVKVILNKREGIAIFSVTNEEGQEKSLEIPLNDLDDEKEIFPLIYVCEPGETFRVSLKSLK